MTRSILLVAALLAGAPSMAFAESIGSNGGPAGGAFMSSYAGPSAIPGQAPVSRSQTTQSQSATGDVTETASTRRFGQRRPAERGGLR